MRAPVEFVVLRHRLTHPDEGPAAVARHCGLRLDSAAKALQRLAHQGMWPETRLVAETYARWQRMARRELALFLPDPHQFLNSYEGPLLISGALAAAEIDGFNIRPSSLLAYLAPDKLQAAARHILDLGGELAARSGANVVLRGADAWLTSDDRDERYAERGQRLLDYRDDPTLQILRGIDRHG